MNATGTTDTDPRIAGGLYWDAERGMSYRARGDAPCGEWAEWSDGGTTDLPVWVPGADRILCTIREAEGETFRDVVLAEPVRLVGTYGWTVEAGQTLTVTVGPSGVYGVALVGRTWRNTATGEVTQSIDWFGGTVNPWDRGKIGL
jgi:hypothetical protein